MWCRLLPRAFALVLLTSGCDSSPQPNVVVHSGESIQAALALMPPAADSWIVKVEAGVYNETVSVDRSGITLLGEVKGDGPADRAVLDGTVEAGRLLKDAVIVSGANFTMQGFTVRNYSGNGVTTSKTRNIVLRDIIADRSGRYGVYPVESEDILVENCVATGISDAGIYVGQSRRAVVRGCKVYGNVAGIEIENTVDALVENNEAWDNTSGLLAFVLPNNPSKVGNNCTMRNNNVHDNNRVNWGDPTAIVSKIPAGIGVAVMAADTTVIENNRITGNRSVGVAVIGLAQLLPDPTGIDVEPDPDGTVLRKNTYQGNGKDPDPGLKGAGFNGGGDILWDGHGKLNCIDEPQGDDLAKVGVAGALPACK